MAFVLFILFFCGLQVSRFAGDGTLAPLLWGVALVLFGASFARLSRGTRSLFLLAAWTAAAAAYGDLSFHARPSLVLRIPPGERVEAAGVIENRPSRRFGRMRFLLGAESIVWRGERYRLQDILLLEAKRPPAGTLEPGRRIACSGTVRTLSVRGGYARYLRQKGVRVVLSCGEKGIRFSSRSRDGVFRDAVRWVRRALEAALFETRVDSSTLDVFRGILFGEKGVLPFELKQSFIHTNTYHVFAVSGLHFGLIALFVVGTLRFAGLARKTAHLAAIPILGFFLAVVGCPPSACRAWIMISLFLLAPCLGREARPLNLVGAAGLILLFLRPGFVGDPGFLLSFAAVISLLGPGRRIDGAWKEWTGRHKHDLKMDPRAFSRWHRVEKGGSAILYSFCAWAGTAPLVAYYFGEFSAVSIPANLVALFFLPLILSCILGAAVLGTLWGLFAEAYAHAGAFLVRTLTAILGAMEGIPGAHRALPGFGADRLWSAYAFLFAAYLAFEARRRIQSRPSFSRRRVT